MKDTDHTPMPPATPTPVFIPTTPDEHFLTYAIGATKNWSAPTKSWFNGCVMNLIQQGADREMNMRLPTSQN